MISAPTSDTAAETEPALPPETRLRLSCVEASDDKTTADPGAVFSSIKETAVALAAAARGQASERARSAAKAAGEVRSAVAEAERLENAVQRATADQARRVAECTRAAFDSLVRHTLQPCIRLDDAGLVLRWNAAMTSWTGIAEEDALGQSISSIFGTAAAEAIEEAGVALREVAAEPGSPGADPVFTIEGAFALSSGCCAERISLLPLCRIPHVVEEIVILINPGN